MGLDTIHVVGHTSDFRQRVESMQLEHESVSEALPDQEIGLRVTEHAREHDVVYKGVKVWEGGAMGRSTNRNLRNRRRKQTIKEKLRVQKKQKKKARPKKPRPTLSLAGRVWVVAGREDQLDARVLRRALDFF